MKLERIDMEIIIQALCRMSQRQDFDKAVLETEMLSLEKELYKEREKHCAAAGEKMKGSLTAENPAQEGETSLHGKNEGEE